MPVPPYAARARTARLLAASPARQGAAAAAPAVRAARAVGTSRPERVELPAGAAARTVDADGRLKLNATAPICAVLGWEPGALGAAFDAGWLLLTQGPGMAGAPRRRNASLAHLVRLASGVERVCLAPAHLQRLGLGEDRVLLAAPLPAAGGLLLVSPAVALAGAPARFLAAEAASA